jgi:hypothetical protein
MDTNYLQINKRNTNQKGNKSVTSVTDIDRSNIIIFYSNEMGTRDEGFCYFYLLSFICQHRNIRIYIRKQGILYLFLSPPHFRVESPGLEQSQ